MLEKLEGFKIYLEKQRNSNHTISSYTRSILQYNRWFTGKFGKELKTLHKENINDYIDTMKKERKANGELLSAKTVNQRLNGLRAFNKFLIEDGQMKEEVIERNMFNKIQQQIASPSKFSKQEVDRFFQVILESKEEMGERESYRDYALAKLMALSGCRISEALSILQEDVHLDAREILIRHGKGNKSRTVLISKNLQRVLSRYIYGIRDQYRLHEVSPYLFVSNRSRSLSRNTINKSFKKYSELALLSEVLSPHDLRHYFCSECIKNGLGIHEVANLAGHSSIQTTSLYTNTSRKTMLEKLEGL
ncbi:tyrosine-type recombinase/integrase [Bacillus sp. CGMCC 1.16541]|uniref:tyrosine-type recombinase/integrase n=1 Tax=Bacillus sp. CGMCC 1.16541 TaxID=2185143 RepID=UPI000D734ED0|nr:tyrosine-type recombinase/integrase [Bacillus sp. CGMCC 1.16541]